MTDEATQLHVDFLAAVHRYFRAQPEILCQSPIKLMGRPLHEFSDDELREWLPKLTAASERREAFERACFAYRQSLFDRLSMGDKIISYAFPALCMALLFICLVYGVP